MAHPAVADTTHQRAEIRQVGTGFGWASFPIGADGHGHHPEHRQREGEPPPRGAVGVGHLGHLPLPATAFGACEALFAPRAQAIPRTVGDAGGQIRQDEPRIGVGVVGPHQQCAGEATGWMLETGAGVLPGLPIG
ncbi:hypothetical protein A6A03_18530 [Chloroflexus islandicus]|uniref:Uncharacterized protein n=1 Tax=Chloroflexus islandicus TaxID=1707952 RepID=A0A178M481_9CHLR|nr:hypothetical protein A6A03_18530 [Chloroflexus islandicus]